jgi:hypothetical protein
LLTPAPEHNATRVNVIVAVPVLVTVKSKNESVLGGSLRTAPSGITEAAGFTTVSFQMPVPEAPVGLVDSTSSRTVPDPALPVVNVTVMFLDWPGMRMLIAGQKVMEATAPPGTHVPTYRVSTVPVFLTTKVT